MIQQRCINAVWSLPDQDRNPIRTLIRSLCKYEVYNSFYPRSCGLNCNRTMNNEGVVTLEDYSCISYCNCTELVWDDYYNVGGICNGSYIFRDDYLLVNPQVLGSVKNERFYINVSHDLRLPTTEHIKHWIP